MKKGTRMHMTSTHFHRIGTTKLKTHQFDSMFIGWTAVIAETKHQRVISWGKWGG